MRKSGLLIKQQQKLGIVLKMIKNHAICNNATTDGAFCNDSAILPTGEIFTSQTKNERQNGLIESKVNITDHPSR
jgi:hypothetical protein